MAGFLGRRIVGAAVRGCAGWEIDCCDRGTIGLEVTVTERRSVVLARHDTTQHNTRLSRKSARPKYAKIGTKDK